MMSAARVIVWRLPATWPLDVPEALPKEQATR
jgi:hypothetical protein